MVTVTVNGAGGEFSVAAKAMDHNAVGFHLMLDAKYGNWWRSNACWHAYH